MSISSISFATFRRITGPELYLTEACELAVPLKLYPSWEESYEFRRLHPQEAIPPPRHSRWGLLAPRVDYFSWRAIASLNLDQTLLSSGGQTDTKKVQVVGLNISQSLAIASTDFTTFRKRSSTRSKGIYHILMPERKITSRSRLAINFILQCIFTQSLHYSTNFLIIYH